jgi:hypothetical protein
VYSIYSLAGARFGRVGGLMADLWARGFGAERREEGFSEEMTGRHYIVCWRDCSVKMKFVVVRFKC